MNKFLIIYRSGYHRHMNFVANQYLQKGLKLNQISKPLKATDISYPYCLMDNKVQVN